MKKIELAYLAGVVDSDGSISIAVDTWRVRKYGRSPAFQEIVAIGQCDEQAVNLAHELFGGSLRTEKPRGENRRPMHLWTVTNRNAIVSIAALMPYLRIKRRQAEIVVALRAIKNRGRKANTDLTAPKVRRIKPAVIAEMNELVTQVRSLNDSRRPLALG
jgi:hypothetical protein